MISIKKSIWITLALIVPLLFILGCSEDKSAVAPSSGLSIVFLAGPSGDVPFNAYVTYKWQAKGGSGNYDNYTYTLTRGGSTVDEGSGVKVNTITFWDLTPGAYTFTINVTDTKGANASTQRSMTVVDKEAAPEVSITQKPMEAGEVVENGSATFGWQGDDPNTDFGVVTGYTFKLLVSDTVTVVEVTELTTATAITFDSLQVGDYTFEVTAHDNGGLSAVDQATFVVVPVRILWIDDYYQGSINAEFVEYQERVETFEGFAWMEFDIHDNISGDGSTIPLIDAIINAPGSTIETVIWDQEETWGPFELYYATNEGSSTMLADFMDNGGNLVLIGNEHQDHMQYDVWNNPPLEGEFEDVYQGLPTEELEVITADTTEEWVLVDSVEVLVRTITYDTTYYPAYEWHGTHYTGSDPIEGLEGYPNISVDVGKDPNTEKNAWVYFNLKPEAVPIFNSPGEPDVWVGFKYDSPDPAGKVVTFGFPIWFSPTAEYKEAIQKVLREEFGM
jgi:hypothetical protein